MIVCEFGKINELNDRILQEIDKGSIVGVAYTVGNIIGGESLLYILTFENNALEVYRGDTIKDTQLWECYRNLKLTGFKHVACRHGYNCLVLKYMVDYVSDRMKKYHSEHVRFEGRVIKSIYDACNLFEKILREKKSIDNEKMRNVLAIALELDPSIYEKPTEFRELISVLLANDKIKKNLLCISVDESIPKALLREKIFNLFKLEEYTKCMVDVSGCNREWAKAIILQWLDAFSIDVDDSVRGDLQDILIENLEFSVRTVGCLKRARIMTLEDLSKRTVDEIKGIRNLNEKCIKEIETVLLKYKISLDR